MSQTSQNPDGSPPRIVHHEWRTAENSAGYLMDKLQSMKQERSNLKLLDIGAGSGTISIAFAKAISDGNGNGTVDAVDLNPDILVRAQAIAESEGVHNIKFQQADAYKLPFADETFDVTHCHQVLSHLKQPQDALREMLRVTKPGGVVAAREGDLETECVWPALPGLIKFHDLAVQFMKLAGGNSGGGRRLLSWALEAGARRDQITPSFGTWCYSEPADKQIWAQGLVNQVRGGNLRKAGLSSGLTTEEDLEEMAKAWQQWVESPEATLGMLHGQIIVQK